MASSSSPSPGSSSWNMRGLASSEGQNCWDSAESVQGVVATKFRHGSELARELGYPRRTSLDILGVSIQMDSCSGSPLKLVLDKVVWRLKFLRLLPVPVKRKVQLLWTLAYSSVYWCAGIAAPTPEILATLRHEALAIFNRSFTHEVPQFLKHALLGWNTDPDFLMQYTALRKAAKMVTHRPAWLDEVPLAEGVDPWTVQLPIARLALDQLGWQPLPHGDDLKRKAQQMCNRRVGFAESACFCNFAVCYMRFRDA